MVNIPKSTLPNSQSIEWMHIYILQYLRGYTWYILLDMHHTTYVPVSAKNNPIGPT